MRVAGKVDEILDKLRNQIKAKEFGPEGRLPSLRTLANNYNTSQETINKVLQTLQAQGIIISLGQKGLYVNAPRIRLPSINAQITTLIKQQGLEGKETQVEPPKVIPVPEDIGALMRLPKNTPVLQRFRKLEVASVVYRIAKSTFPKRLITDEMMDAIQEDPEYDIVTTIKNNSGLIIKNVHEEVISRLPTLYEQELLQIVRNNPVIELKRVCFNENKDLVIMYNHQILNVNHFLLTYDYDVAYWE